MKEIKDKIDLLRNSISKIENKEYGGLFNQITDILDDLYSSVEEMMENQAVLVENLSCLDEDISDIQEELFEELQKLYTDDSHGFEIERFGETYRFLSKALVHESAKRLFSLEKETKLSNAAMETLAIIAYKQPITRVEIEEIRGVSADVMLRKLEARGLIQESGRSDAPGKPFLYTVTDEFMNTFHLTSLSELPDLPQFNQDENEDIFNQ